MRCLHLIPFPDVDSEIRNEFKTIVRKIVKRTGKKMIPCAIKTLWCEGFAHWEVSNGYVQLFYSENGHHWVYKIDKCYK